MELLKYIQLTAWSVGVVSAAIFATDLAVSDQFRRKFGSALKRFDSAKWLQEWPAQGDQLFTYVFGERHISWLCLARSILASLSAVLIIFILFLMLSDTSVERWWLSWNTVPPLRIAFGLLLPVLFNIVTDYLALMETRAVIKRIGNSGNIFRVLGFFLLDAAATIAVFVISYSLIGSYLRDGILGWYFEWGPYGLGWNNLVLSFQDGAQKALIYLSGFTIDPQSVKYFESPIMFFTTFGTSIWIWVTLIAVLGTRLLNFLLGGTWVLLRDRVFDVENRPLQFLAWISGASVLASYVVLAPIFVQW